MYRVPGQPSTAPIQVLFRRNLGQLPSDVIFLMAKDYRRQLASHDMHTTYECSECGSPTHTHNLVFPDGLLNTCYCNIHTPTSMFLRTTSDLYGWAQQNQHLFNHRASPQISGVHPSVTEYCTPATSPWFQQLCPIATHGPNRPCGLCGCYEPSAHHWMNV